MKKYKIKIFFSIVVLAFVFFAVFPVGAQQVEPQGLQPRTFEFLQGLVPCGTSANPQPCTICDFYKLLQNIINFFIYGSGPLATLFIIVFVVPGFFFSGGDPKKITNAREKLKLIVIGLIWIAISWLVINTIINLVANPNTLPLPWNRVVCSANAPQAPGGNTPNEGAPTGGTGSGGYNPLGFGSRLDNTPPLSEDAFGGGETGGGGAGGSWTYSASDNWQDGIDTSAPSFHDYELGVYPGGVTAELAGAEGSSLRPLLESEVSYSEADRSTVENYINQHPEASSLRPLLEPEHLTTQEAQQIVSDYIAQYPEASSLRPLLEPEHLAPQQQQQETLRKVTKPYPVPRYNRNIDDYVAGANLSGVDPNKVKALIMTESSGNPREVSKDNDGKASYGLMQVRPEMARRYDSSLQGLTDVQIGERLKDPAYNINIGSKILRDMEQKHGSTETAVAVYNGGPLAIKSSRDCPGLQRWQCEWDNAEHTIPNSRAGHPGYGPTRREVSVFGQLYNQLSGR